MENQSALGVRDLVLRYGWNTTAYQILNPGIDHWLAASEPGVVGFVNQPQRWIAAGAPICEPRQLGQIAAEFEDSALERGKRVCYFCAMDRLRQVLAGSSRHTCVAIGAEPVWDPRHWAETVQGRSSLRAQLNRARNKQITVLAASGLYATTMRPDLRQCLDDWVESRPLPPMHFLVEPETLDGLLADRLLYVAMQEGRPIGFLVASPVSLRNGYLIEQVIRGHGAPNGTAELLIDACMRDLARQGCAYVTQGLVALSRHAEAEIAQNPLWLRALMAWAHAHGNRFYHFRGLEAFREKMQPQRWETIYAIANERTFSPVTLYAAARAFFESPPILALGRALAKALRQEAIWLGERFGRLRRVA